MLNISRTVSSADLKVLQKKIVRLSKQAAKAGIEAPQLTSTETTVVVGKNSAGIEIVKQAHAVEVTASTTHMCRPGYELVAIVTSSIEREDINEAGSRIITRLDGATDDLSAYRDTALVCAHCKSRRRRNTILVIRDAAGNLAPYGTDCAEEYIPGASNSAKPLEWLIAWDESAAASYDTEGYWDSGASLLGLDDVLNFTIEILKEGPYVRANEIGNTKGEVLHAMEPRNLTHMSYEERQNLFAFQNRCHDRRDDNEPTIKAVKDWVESLAGKSDYEANLQAAFAAEGVSYRCLGLVVSSVSVYYRNKGEQAARERKTTEWVGEIKKRQDFGTGTLVSVRPIESEWGTTYLTKISLDNALLVWWSSRRVDLDEGTKVTIKATVKKHDEFKGEKQTVVTRAVLKAVK